MQEQEGSSALLRSQLDRAEGERRSLEFRLQHDSVGPGARAGAEASGQLRTLQEQLAFKEQEVVRTLRAHARAQTHLQYPQCRAVHVGHQMVFITLRSTRNRICQTVHHVMGIFNHITEYPRTPGSGFALLLNTLGILFITSQSTRNGRCNVVHHIPEYLERDLQYRCRLGC